MSTIKEIESAIKKLPPKDLKEFRDWFEKYEENLWDTQLNKDIKSGKLDKIAEQVINDFENGKCSKL